MSPSSLPLGLVFLVALTSGACARERASDATPASSAKPQPIAAQKPPPSPTEELAKLGPVVAEVDHHQAPPPTTPLKLAGSIGEELEGDLSYFKLLSVRPCTDEKSTPPAAPGAAPNPAARTVVAAEVEIVAKRKMNVSPRHLMLGKGGIMLDPSMNLKRELKGCTPLLQVSYLHPKESVKGFVLFDIPTTGPGSKLSELNLVYHPVIFGGSAAIHVTLAGVKLEDAKTAGG